MPKFSAFTPFGLLRFSGKPSRGETIFRALVAALGGQQEVSRGSRMHAHLYAQAMGMARAEAALRTAQNQYHPTTVGLSLAPLKEDEYGIVPSPTATLSERRAELAAHWTTLPHGTRTNVELGLTALLGSEFVAYRTTPPADIVNSPTNLGDQPMNLQLPSVPRKLVRITEPISLVPGELTVGYEQVAQPITLGGPTTSLLAGDKLVVEPEIAGITETVEVLEATAETFRAEFTNPHTTGCVATTMPYPDWQSTQRHSLIVVRSAATAIDPEVKRKVHRFMRRLARGVSTWSIVVADDPATDTLEFELGAEGLGYMTVESAGL